MPGNRERRAAKQRRRDAKRGHAPASALTDPGLAPEALQGVLRSTAADLAAGDEAALTELRHVLVEHLARRRERVLDACDVVTAEVPVPAGKAGLAAELARGGSVTSWADREGLRTEEAAVATVRLLASLT
ncbi:hypothetical protein [Actinomycetospora cinnamomea]|uniref:Uncharacterized protein n=1 Tax=Actinomycetospora cinnamomea TaxID=663609 RepID=A0A2U1FFU0_9PSEU|nr:hypothetical protein [Actinomycetospora cinnamomea]PVZ10996.1 hypothetical protein C8D89_104210 [Actinomycetospora cinnamomea]